MNDSQRPQNPDVNSYQPDTGPGETTTSNEKKDQDVIPVPPDATPAAPVEEPPGSDGPPVGDVDDSPKRIA